MRVALALLALPILVVTPSAAQSRKFDLDAIGRIVQLSDPRPTPDGKQVAVVVSRPDYESNETRNELILIDVATGAQRNLAPGRRAVWSPRWSPSGDRLAFLAPGDSIKSPQIWVLPFREGGEAKTVTSSREGVRQFAWRPDGNGFAFVTSDSTPIGAGPERHNKSFEVEWNDYLATSAPMPRHIWTVSATGGAASRLTSGAWSLTTLNETPIRWTPDGTKIVFARQPGGGSAHWYGSSLAVVPAAGGQVTDLVKGYAMPLEVSPNGRWIAYSGPRGVAPEFSSHGIFLIPIDGGAPKLGSDIDIAHWQPIWFDDNALLLCGTDGTRNRMWRKPLDGASTPIDVGNLEPDCGDVNVTASGAVAMVASRSDRPSELYWIDRVGAAPRALTRYNEWISEYAIGGNEGVQWKSDKFSPDGVLTKPVGFDPSRKYPLVLAIHGGPMGSSTVGFDPLPQLLAAQGFLVFQPNYRGSTGLGNAYQSAVIGDAGEGPGRDVMSGVETLIRRGIVDTTRMGVSGWSYGGYMTTWLLAHYPRWKAGMAGAAVTDYADGYYLSDYGPAFGAAWGGSPFMAPYDRIVKAQSPITYANRIKAPTLILATTGDQRVPIVQSYKLYRALLDFGVAPVKFVAYPVAGHFPRDPVHARDVNRRWVAWFAEKLP